MRRGLACRGRLCKFSPRLPPVGDSLLPQTELVSQLLRVRCLRIIFLLFLNALCSIFMNQLLRGFYQIGSFRRNILCFVLFGYFLREFVLVAEKLSCRCIGLLRDVFELSIEEAFEVINCPGRRMYKYQLIVVGWNFLLDINIGLQGVGLIFLVVFL